MLCNVSLGHYREALWFLDEAKIYLLGEDICINCSCVVTRWQWLFYMYTKYEIVY
jgi:hypothetical protein